MSWGASDIWSLAATIFNIYTGLTSSTPPAVWPVDLAMPAYMPWSLQRLLKRCLNLCSGARPSIDELVTELQVGLDDAASAQSHTHRAAGVVPLCMDAGA